MREYLLWEHEDQSLNSRHDTLELYCVESPGTVVIDASEPSRGCL